MSPQEAQQKTKELPKGWAYIPVMPSKEEPQEEPPLPKRDKKKFTVTELFSSSSVSVL